MAGGGRLEREFRTLAPKLQVVMGIVVKGNLIGTELFGNHAPDFELGSP